MRVRPTPALVLLALATTALAATVAPRAQADPPAVTRTAGTAVGLRYEEMVVGGAHPDAPLPMIVALHMWGSGPRGMGRLFERDLGCPARVVLPRGPHPHGTGYSWIDARAADPDDVLAHDVRLGADRLAAFVDTVRRDRPTVGSTVVTGFSQGGVMAFALAVHAPELVGEAYVVAGLLPRPMWPRDARRPYPRIVALHGDGDTLVPFARTRAAIAYMERLGLDVELHVERGVGHRFTPSMKRQLRDWLRDACRARTR